MISIILDGNNITMIRGDTESFVVDCIENGTQHPFEEGDTVSFTVRWSELSETVYIQKRITSFLDGIASIDLMPEDTANMKPHTYRYDIEVTFKDGTVKTIIGPSNFIIKGDVTRSG